MSARRTPFLVLLAAALAGPARADEAGSKLPPPSPELLGPRTPSPGQPSMHPAVILRDATGASVAVSGQPVSAARTCDGCHDVAWIATHDRHADVWARERGSTETAGGPAASNCVLCHVRGADDGARARAMAAGHFAEAETATLAGTGLVGDTGAIRESPLRNPHRVGPIHEPPARGVAAVHEPPLWQWRTDAFAADGSVAAATLGLGRPGDRACGFCHGVVHADPSPLALDPDGSQGMTELGGVVFSGQRIRDSAVNLAGKDDLGRPWDVHAERMVSCASCHFSPNHPAYAFADHGLEHLQFDARRLALTDYLRRPDHRLASGPGRGGQPATLRACGSCHEPAKAHAFLPRAERHFSALACEACHVPMAYAPARQEVDWTMLTAARKERVVHRGLRDDGFVLGFRPALLRRGQGGDRKLGPSNVVVTYRWVESLDQGSRAVAADVLERAFFAGGAHRPELVRVLDRDGDGQLADAELILDTAAKVQVARDLLVAAGVRSPAMVAEARVYALAHGTSPGRFATRDCSSCHEAGSRIGEPFLLASALPFGVMPAFAGGPAPGRLARDGDRLVLNPDTAGLHVFGHTRNRLLDVLGVVLLAGTFVGAATHGLLRFRSVRRRQREQS